MPGTDNRGDVAMPDTGNRGTDSTRDHTRRTCLVVARQPMLAVMPARLRDLLVLPHLLAHLRHRDLQLDLPAVLFQVLCRAPRRRSVSVVKAKKNGKCMRIQAFSYLLLCRRCTSRGTLCRVPGSIIALPLVSTG